MVVQVATEAASISKAGHPKRWQRLLDGIIEAEEQMLSPEPTDTCQAALGLLATAVGAYRICVCRGTGQREGIDHFSWSQDGSQCSTDVCASRLEFYRQSLEKGEVLTQRIEQVPHRFSEDWIAVGIASCTLVPVMVNGTFWGAMTICSRTYRQASKRETPLLISFAKSFAMAVERDQAQRNLEAERRLLTALMDNIPDKIYFKDSHSRFIRVSRHKARCHGLASPDAIIGKTDFDLYPHASAQERAEDEQRIMRTGEPIVGKEEFEILPNGEMKWVSSTKMPLRATDGSVIGTFGISRDITDRKAAEGKLLTTIEQLHQIMEQTVGALACTSEMRDPYTAGHQRRVGLLAVEIGKVMGLSETQLEGLRVGGILHDIGKINVPSEILVKPGRIEPVEFEMIKLHAKNSFDILRSIAFPWPVAKMAHQHHERLDGSGYPNHLHARDIILEARILAVADVVEAMATHRPYRPALGLEAAMQEIQLKAHSCFDPDVVAACIRVCQAGFNFQEGPTELTAEVVIEKPAHQQALSAPR